MDDIAELVRGEVEESVKCEEYRVSLFAPLLILIFHVERAGDGEEAHTGRGRCHGKKTCGRLSSS
jgi:hypothetical protein